MQLSSISLPDKILSPKNTFKSIQTINNNYLSVNLNFEQHEPCTLDESISPNSLGVSRAEYMNKQM